MKVITWKINESMNYLPQNGFALIFITCLPLWKLFLNGNSYKINTRTSRVNSPYPYLFTSSVLQKPKTFHFKLKDETTELVDFTNVNGVELIASVFHILWMSRWSSTSFSIPVKILFRFYSSFCWMSLKRFSMVPFFSLCSVLVVAAVSLFFRPGQMKH